ncbi:MAG: helix-turn-helix domain-containing protein [Clostridia bacterium]|nr:helix-turn-helix domain-containing protein [Clostridia bacterium]
MESISYHSFNDKFKKTLFACNRSSDRAPIMVNCAGSTVLRWNFKSVNDIGRADCYFLYLKTGTLNISIAEDKHTIHSGTLIIIPPNTPYAYWHTGTDELIYYWIHFTGSHANEMLRRFDISPLPLIRSIPQISSAIDYQMAKIFDIYIKKGQYRDSELSHCMDAILIEIAKGSITAENSQRRLETSIKYINNNYTSDITVPELAQMEFLSVSRYTALFKEIMNTSPYQYIINLRLNAACEMLRNSTLSITKIAELLGFQNCFFFSKLFKKHLNMSPLQYRKSESVMSADGNDI